MKYWFEWDFYLGDIDQLYKLMVMYQIVCYNVVIVKWYRVKNFTPDCLSVTLLLLFSTAALTGPERFSALSNGPAF